MGVHTKSLQSCLILCDPKDRSLPGSSVCGILQERVLKWVAVSSSRGSFHLGDWTPISYVSWIGRRVLCHQGHLGSPCAVLWCAQLVSCVWLFATPRTITRQAPLFVGILQARILEGLPCLPPGDPPDSGTESTFLMSPALAGRFFTTSATWEDHVLCTRHQAYQDLDFVLPSLQNCGK